MTYWQPQPKSHAASQGRQFIPRRFYHNGRPAQNGCIEQGVLNLLEYTSLVKPQLAPCRPESMRSGPPENLV